MCTQLLLWSCICSVLSGLQYFSNLNKPLSTYFVAPHCTFSQKYCLWSVFSMLLWASCCKLLAIFSWSTVWGGFCQRAELQFLIQRQCPEEGTRAQRSIKAGIPGSMLGVRFLWHATIYLGTMCLITLECN